MLFLLQVQELLQTPQLSASRWGGTRFSTLISKSILGYLACRKHLLTLRYFLGNKALVSLHLQYGAVKTSFTCMFPALLLKVFHLFLPARKQMADCETDSSVQKADINISRAQQMYHYLTHLT